MIVSTSTKTAPLVRTFTVIFQGNKRCRLHVCCPRQQRKETILLGPNYSLIADHTLKGSPSKDAKKGITKVVSYPLCNNGGKYGGVPIHLLLKVYGYTSMIFYHFLQKGQQLL